MFINTHAHTYVYSSEHVYYYASECALEPTYIYIIFLIYIASIYIYVLRRFTSKKPCGHLFTEAIAPKPQTKPGEKPKACFLGLLQRSLVAILDYIYKSHCPKAPKKARRKAQSMFSCLPAGHYSIITAGQPCA